MLHGKMIAMPIEDVVQHCDVLGLEHVPAVGHKVLYP